MWKRNKKDKASKPEKGKKFMGLKNLKARERQGDRKPISRAAIYKIIVWVTVSVACAFFLKNVITLSLVGSLVIGGCLAVLAGILTFMKVKKIKPEKREIIMAIVLIFFVFVISISSGKSYSDDFPMYLALIGVTGLYLEPKVTKIQIILADIVFVLMYIIHPEKGGEIGQYILCMAVFTLAGYLFYLTIKRGRAFIDISESQAEEAKDLLRSIREMGDIIQEDFDASSHMIDESTKGLKNGSNYIIKGTEEVASDCNVVQDTIQESGKHIEDLNAQVRRFEGALADNQANIDALRNQLELVTGMIAKSNTVFEDMKARMGEVSIIANRLSDISVKTTVLSLNAAVEAANVGDNGNGFEVVASEMKQLAENSDEFVLKVTDVVEQLMAQVDKTAQQFIDSTRELKNSSLAMNDLQSGYTFLKNEFGQLYSNIEAQNKSVNQVDNVFRDLRSKVVEMRSFSMQNQTAVEDITEAMSAYKLNVNRVVNNTKGMKISSVIGGEE